MSLSTVDDNLYFMCNTDDFKFLAEMIQHVPLPLRARYIFCCAPINRKMSFVCSMFLKVFSPNSIFFIFIISLIHQQFARQYSRNEPITFNWLCSQVAWPFTIPKTILDLVHLEAVFDVLDLYLWFSYRFMDIFPDGNLVRDIQSELDEIIQQGVFQITKLLQNSESIASSAQSDDNSGHKRRQGFKGNTNWTKITKISI